MPKNWQHVSKKEFYAFVDAYPHRLIYNQYMDNETWNDFRDGRKYPDSVVAIASLYGDEFRICRDFIGG